MKKAVFVAAEVFISPKEQAEFIHDSLDININREILEDLAVFSDENVIILVVESRSEIFSQVDSKKLDSVVSTAYNSFLSILKRENKDARVELCYDKDVWKRLSIRESATPSPQLLYSQAILSNVSLLSSTFVGKVLNSLDENDEPIEEPHIQLAKNAGIGDFINYKDL